MDAKEEFISVLRRSTLVDESTKKIVNSENNGLAIKTIDSIIYDSNTIAMDFNLTVNYNRNLADVVGGSIYNFLLKDKVRGSKNVTTTMFFDNGKSIELEMAEERCRPANAYELIAFGEKNPKAIRKLPVIALGTTWGGLLGHSALVLDNSPNNKDEYYYLALSQWPMKWPEGCCFLGVYF